MTFRHPLSAYGWDEDVAARFERLPADQTPREGEVEVGRVVRIERIHAFVRAAGGEIIANVTAGNPLPAVGDWVSVSQRDGGAASILARVERRSVLVRRDPDSDQIEQVLAANVELVAIFAPLDRLNLARVERELLVAWESGAKPIVLLTKADLVPEPDAVVEEATRRLASADVIVTSGHTGLGVEAVRAALRPNHTAVLLGPSGAGKSTLANALLGEELLKTGAVRAADRRGRHTTTNRQLVPVPGGGVLIDTPGIRSLGVAAGEESLAAAFADIDALAEGCRFSDCRHDREPGCAVQAAADAGDLDADRLSSFVKLADEIAVANRIQTNRSRPG